jgi:hypothetical protein
VDYINDGFFGDHIVVELLVEIVAGHAAARKGVGTGRSGIKSGKQEGGTV